MKKLALTVILVLILSLFCSVSASAGGRVENGWYEAKVYVTTAVVGGDEIKIQTRGDDIVGYFRTGRDCWETSQTGFGMSDLFGFKKGRKTTLTIDMDSDTRFYLPDGRSTLQCDQYVGGVNATMVFYVSGRRNSVTVMDIYIDGEDLSGAVGEVVSRVSSRKAKVEIDGKKKTVLFPDSSTNILKLHTRYEFPVLIESGGNIVCLATPVSYSKRPGGRRDR